jgi:hypothetical protein
MAFTLPVFNLTCNIFDGPWLTKVFRLDSSCNLAFGRRVQQGFLSGGNFDFGGNSLLELLMLPPETDIRSGVVVLHTDIVEVPAGSGRWYQVLGVDDIGKGFDNEHRCALLVQISHLTDATAFAGCVWPVPIP